MHLGVSCKEDMVNGKVGFGQSCRGLKNIQEEKENFIVVTSSFKRDYDIVIFTVIFVLICKGEFCL